MFGASDYKNAQQQPIDISSLEEEAGEEYFDWKKTVLQPATTPSLQYQQFVSKKYFGSFLDAPITT